MWSIVVLVCSSMCTTVVHSTGDYTTIFRDKESCEQTIVEKFSTLDIPQGKVVDAQCVNWFKA